MHCTNCVYKGQLPVSKFINTETTWLNLCEFADKVYNHRPRMLLYRSQNITLIIFSSLKFRTMGTSSDETAHSFIVQEFLLRSDRNYFNLMMDEGMDLTLKLPCCLTASICLR